MEHNLCMSTAEMPPENQLSLAMAYVPYQQWAQPYDMDIALARGTIFSQLDLPFLGEGVYGNGR